jgi:hypothetical protein
MPRSATINMVTIMVGIDSPFVSVMQVLPIVFDSLIAIGLALGG